MVLIEECAAHRRICRENSSDRLPLPPADIDDMLKLREVVGLQKSLHGASGEIGRRLVKNLILGGVFGTVSPNRFTVQIDKGSFARLDTVKKMTPRPPDIRPADERRPRANGVGESDRKQSPTAVSEKQRPSCSRRMPAAASARSRR